MPFIKSLFHDWCLVKLIEPLPHRALDKDWNKAQEMLKEYHLNPERIFYHPKYWETNHEKKAASSDLMKE